MGFLNSVYNPIVEYACPAAPAAAPVTIGDEEEEEDVTAPLVSSMKIVVCSIV